MDDLYETEINQDELIFPKQEELINNGQEKDEKSTIISDFSVKGYQLLKANDIQGAINSFKNILELDSNNNYALVGLGDCERKQNNFLAAINHYNSCLTYHPSNNYALFGLADCYKALNQYRKAIEIWEQYLIHDDRNITVLTRVADAYRKIHDFKRSKDLYLKVMEMEQDNAYKA